MPRKPKSRNPRRPIVVVDVPTAAALLDVSAATLYRWIKYDDFPYLTLPSGVMRISLQTISDITGFSVDYLIRLIQDINEF